jgi:meso-butanediol dehydrogenase / (S,S)-butanediol dehydrogenase / diacetyl reductase
MEGIEGAIAVVTGGASGIGRATAFELGKNGAHVVILDRDSADEVVNTMRDQGMSASSYVTDVCSFGALTETHRAITADVGNPQLLVNNAGGLTHAFLLDLTPDSWHDVVQLNLTAAFYTTRLFAPAMVERQGGAIVNIASTSARFSYPRSAHYSAAKAGIVALTRSTAFELGSSGVRANSVSPGSIETPAWGSRLDEAAFRDHEAAATALGRVGQPADVARLVAFLLSDAAAYITGENVLCDGGYSATGQTHSGPFRTMR